MTSENNPKSHHILVADDEESLRYTFKTFLEKEGYSVSTASDLPSALKEVSQTDFDLIFADIIFGNQSGIQILEEIKRLNKKSPVIMITGQPSIETASDAVRLGAFDYVPKPVRKETLLRLAKMALSHKTLADEKEKAELEKERYRYNLEAIFRSVKDAIITVDREFQVLEANEAVQTIFNVSPREMIGNPSKDILKGSYREVFKVLEKSFGENNTIQEYRVECSHKSKPHQVLILTTYPLQDANRETMGTVLVARDITRLSELEKELLERQQYNKIIGKSRKMQDIFNLLDNLVDLDTTVLITGESGTGKDMIAKAIHQNSPRSSYPFIRVNCSALAENLLESELFGHVKGAFTGAINDRLGRFQSADKGTLFLDEIGDISPAIQVKLLRILQDKEFEKVGDSTPIKVDVRIITATNRDLKKKVRKGEFREDLYYRLKVVEISMPPLRERREDIPLLIQHFGEFFNKKMNKKIREIADETGNIFMQYEWPGNIRELEHALEHAFVLCHGEVIQPEHLPLELRNLSNPIPKQKPSTEVESIIQALKKAGWNKTEAARILGISRQTIYRKMIQYNLNKTYDEL